MATIYKRARRKPIPKGAEIVTSKGKAYAVWTSRGWRQRAPLSDDGKAVIREADNYTVEYFDHNGKRKRVGSNTPDKDAAQRLANHLETEAMAMQRRRGVIDERQERMVEESRRPIEEYLQAFEAKMTMAARSMSHIQGTVNMIRTVVAKAGFATARDIYADGGHCSQNPPSHWDARQERRKKTYAGNLGSHQEL